MTYPRIYSMSTVGILRHYNQTYLFDPIRTDFTGGNGVGKSMLADLLQIIFIPYYHLITFETEGLDKGLRQVEKLPYKVTEAYTFLNVEVSQNRFITIGTCIPNNRNRPITPFLVLSETDASKKLHEIAYPKEKILLHGHFIKNKSIPPLQELTKYLRDERGLYLSYYGNEEKKNEFFSFLYNKEILPINLTIKDNLKAFAKVIQSFSRAKALDVNSSESLKAFLFEDENSYNTEFKNQREKLQQLLLEYKTLENEIDILEKKQESLTDLKRQETIFVESREQFLVADIKFAFQALQIAKDKSERAREKLEHDRREITRLELRKTKLGKLVKMSEAQLNAHRKSLEALKDYSNEHTKLEQVQSELSQLINLETPTINEHIEIGPDKLEIDEFNYSEILRRVAEFNPVYRKYGLLSEMEKMYRAQKKDIEDHRRSIDKEIQQLEEWIKLFSSDKGLLAKVLEERESLTPKQEAALFHLLDVYWQKPDKAQAGTRFTVDLEVLEDENIELDRQNDGFWLDLGRVKEFFPERQEQQLLDNPVEFEKVVRDRISVFEKQLDSKRSELEELNSFQHGETSNVSFLQLDQNLRDATALKNLKQTAAIIQNLDGKIESLRVREQTKLEALSDLEQQISFSIKGGDLQKQIADRKSGLEIKESRRDILFKAKAQEDEKLSSLVTSVLPSSKQQFDSEKERYDKCNLDYQEKANEVRQHRIQFELDEAESIAETLVKELKGGFSEAQTAYFAKYQSVANLFEETADKNNPEVNEQIDSQQYGFAMLEHVLLGSQNRAWRQSC